MCHLKRHLQSGGTFFAEILQLGAEVFSQHTEWRRWIKKRPESQAGYTVSC